MSALTQNVYGNKEISFAEHAIAGNFFEAAVQSLFRWESCLHWSTFTHWPESIVIIADLSKSSKTRPLPLDAVVDSKVNMGRFVRTND